jgi:hypothetical protein
MDDIDLVDHVAIVILVILMDLRPSEYSELLPVATEGLKHQN